MRLVGVARSRGGVREGAAGPQELLCAARALRRERGLETIGVLGHSRGASSALVLFGGSDDDVDGAARRELLPRAALAAVAPRFVVAGVLGKFSAEELARSAAGVKRKILCMTACAGCAGVGAAGGRRRGRLG
jgi:hypothetical protein